MIGMVSRDDYVGVSSTSTSIPGSGPWSFPLFLARASCCWEAAKATRTPQVKGQYKGQLENNLWGMLFY